jgi:hypothetical protein
MTLYVPCKVGADASSVFFDLANERSIKYKTASGKTLKIHQEREIKNCTGGIVWETAFLLGTFLEDRGVENLGWSRTDAASDGNPENTPAEREIAEGGGQRRRSKGKDDGPAPKKRKGSGEDKRPPRVLEVGAGCGLLGLILAHMGCSVVLTEAQEAMANLEHNVEKNADGCPGRNPRAQRLDWTAREDLEALRGSKRFPFDVIVGTDVVFNTQMVEPLLVVLHAAAHASSTVLHPPGRRAAAAQRETGPRLDPLLSLSPTQLTLSHAPPPLPFPLPLALL